jgi:ubiquinone/menaquinone biosynthesis C-methylase UbiE
MMRRREVILVSVVFLAVFLLCAFAQPSDEISRLAQIMGWKAGQVIADVGAGEGYFAFAAAAAVGETGKVYATELDKKKLKALDEEVTRRGLKNVVVVEAAEKETNLPEACCTSIFLRRVYHHLTAPKEMDASLWRSLKPGGVLAVIDFPPRKSLTLTSPVKGVPGNRGGHGIPQKVLVEELRLAGFTLEKTYDDWPDDSYCVLFQRPAP